MPRRNDNDLGEDTSEDEDTPVPKKRRRPRRRRTRVADPAAARDSEVDDIIGRVDAEAAGGDQEDDGGSDDDPEYRREEEARPSSLDCAACGRPPGGAGPGDDLMSCCQSCFRVFHRGCALGREAEGGGWTCQECGGGDDVGGRKRSGKGPPARAKKSDPSVAVIRSNVRSPVFRPNNRRTSVAGRVARAPGPPSPGPAGTEEEEPAIPTSLVLDPSTRAFRSHADVVPLEVMVSLLRRASRGEVPSRTSPPPIIGGDAVYVHQTVADGFGGDCGSRSWREDGLALAPLFTTERRLWGLGVTTEVAVAPFGRPGPIRRAVWTPGLAGLVAVYYGGGGDAVPAGGGGDAVPAGGAGPASGRPRQATGPSGPHGTDVPLPAAPRTPQAATTPPPDPREPPSPVGAALRRLPPGVSCFRRPAPTPPTSPLPAASPPSHPPGTGRARRKFTPRRTDLVTSKQSEYKRWLQRPPVHAPLSSSSSLEKPILEQGGPPSVAVVVGPVVPAGSRRISASSSPGGASSVVVVDLETDREIGCGRPAAVGPAGGFCIRSFARM